MTLNFLCIFVISMNKYAWGNKLFTVFGLLIKTWLNEMSKCRPRVLMLWLLLFQKKTIRTERVGRSEREREREWVINKRIYDAFSASDRNGKSFTTHNKDFIRKGTLRNHWYVSNFGWYIIYDKYIFYGVRHGLMNDVIIIILVARPMHINVCLCVCALVQERKEKTLSSLIFVVWQIWHQNSEHKGRFSHINQMRIKHASIFVVQRDVCSVCNFNYAFILILMKILCTFFSLVVLQIRKTEVVVVVWAW